MYYGTNQPLESTPSVDKISLATLEYSETADKGHSERGKTSQQRTSRNYSCIRTCTLYTSERGQPLYKDKTAGPEGVLVPLYFSFGEVCTCLKYSGSSAGISVTWLARTMTKEVGVAGGEGVAGGGDVVVGSEVGEEEGGVVTGTTTGVRAHRRRRQRERS